MRKVLFPRVPLPHNTPPKLLDDEAMSSNDNHDSNTRLQIHETMHQMPQYQFDGICWSQRDPLCPVLETMVVDLKRHFEGWNAIKLNEEVTNLLIEPHPRNVAYNNLVLSLQGFCSDLYRNMYDKSHFTDWSREFKQVQQKQKQKPPQDQP